MLSAQDNEILTRVGPGTAMGDLLRRYWTPALLSSELPRPDCAPVRVRLLGENLVAFRDTGGEVGLVAEGCPHRGASVYFGRNEEHGLRCVYHGWKFDRTGRCVDMPSEPARGRLAHLGHRRRPRRSGGPHHPGGEPRVRRVTAAPFLTAARERTRHLIGSGRRDDDPRPFPRGNSGSAPTKRARRKSSPCHF